MSKEKVSLEYKVSFRFTTFDLRRSMATGRTGSINIISTVPKEDIDPSEVKQLCVNEVLRLKPKWNILTMDVNDISPLKQKRSNKITITKP
jgi:hypothetical protein